MKNFFRFINEDFNSSGASQFLINVSTISKKSSKDTKPQEMMMFYEHVTGSSINLSRYVKSFLSSNVSEIMRAPSNDYRVLVYSSSTGFDVFVWYASVQHTQMTKSLDTNKDLKKYPSNIKYNYLYLESQMYMKGDSITSTWCFPFVLWQGTIVVNLNLEALTVLNDAKDLKKTFQFSDNQWASLLKKQECNL